MLKAKLASVCGTKHMFVSYCNNKGYKATHTGRIQVFRVVFDILLLL